MMAYTDRGGNHIEAEVSTASSRGDIKGNEGPVR